MKELPRGIAAIDQRPLRLPRIGIIRPGEKVENKETGKDHPRELDYFNLEDAPLVRDFYSALQGLAPEDLRLRELDIIFPTTARGTICETCYKAYGAGGFWQCRGNGIFAYSRDAKDERPCPGEDCEMVLKKKCRRQMTLSFICYRTPGVGVYQFTTGGWRAIENTLAQLDMFDHLFRELDGGFAGIPMKLYREPYDSSYVDNDGKRHGRVHHCIRLDIAGSYMEARRLMVGGGHLEIAPPLEECDPSMYPESYRQQVDESALPPAAVVPDEIIPAEPEGEPVPEDVQIGFDILDLSDVARKALLDQYAGEFDKLAQYLDAKVAARDAQPTGTNGSGKRWF